MSLDRVVVVGAGLVGASVGMALTAAGVDVGLVDTEPSHVRLATERGAGHAYQPAPPVDLAVLAVPPTVVAPALREAQTQRLAAAYTDVASVKELPLRAARQLGCDLGLFVGGHPVAGGQTGGPLAARADMFTGRPWVLTPTAETAAAALAPVRRLVATCGGVPVVLSAEDHDDLLALTSHAPQLVASTLAALLADGPEAATGLVGQGLRDVLRIAGSPPELWAEIAIANAGPVAAVLERLSEDLGATAAALRDGRAEAVLALVRRGNAGLARL